MIDEHLESFGAVSIEGPKYCGKTWTALNHAESVFFLMDPARNYANRQIASTNPASVLTGAQPRLIDEWQEAPGVWDAIRFEVDRGKGKGRYLLAGSANPRSKAPLHSGTGRISRLSMWPMSLFESGESTGDISLASIIRGEPIEDRLYPYSSEQLAFVAARGGWPESIGLPLKPALRLPEQYLKSLYSSDISTPDNTRRDPRKVEALVMALARSNATLVTNTTLKWDVSQGLGSISAPTIAAYLAALKRVFVLEEVPGWAPDRRAKARMRTGPKRFLVDPSLAIAALGMSPETLINDPATFGMVFESLCLRDLSVYADCLSARLFHYHDNSGLEVDAIVENRDGSYIAIEIKLSGESDDHAAMTLLGFARKMEKQGIPAPKALVVISGGGLAHIRQDGIYVVPITCLRE
jgi:predicted AAA+ superfamily ATPase